MTVTYAKKASNASLFTFFKLLLRWRGSIWQAIHFEFCAYFIVYILLTTVNLVFFNATGNKLMILATYCNDEVSGMLRLVAFVMGFYVTQIYNRWWSIYTMLPWPDTFCYQLGGFYPNLLEEQQVHKTMVRYLCLSYVLVFRDISEKIRLRFPSLKSMEGSLLTTEERLSMERTDPSAERVQWMPIEWIFVLLRRSHEKANVNDYQFTRLVKTVLDYRERLHNILQFDTVNLPLAYTQVVHLFVYMHLLLLLFASQSASDEVEMLVMLLYCMLQFVFLLGLLKMAEVMINPLGNDADDFEINTIIERNFQISYRSVEEFHQSKPKKADIQLAAKFPKQTTESMIENIIRPTKIVQGSAVPDKEEKVSVEIANDFEKQSRAASRELPNNPAEKVTTAEPLPPTPIKQKKKPTKSAVRGMRRAKKSSEGQSKNSSSRPPSSLMTPLRTPEESQMKNVKSSGKTKKDLAADLMERMELLRKVEKRREKMELDRTQLDEEDEDPMSRGSVPTPRASKIQSRELSPRMSQLSSPIPLSMAKTQMSSIRKRDISKTKEEAFRSFVKNLKNSTALSPDKDTKGKNE